MTGLGGTNGHMLVVLGSLHKHTTLFFSLAGFHFFLFLFLISYFIHFPILPLSPRYLLIAFCTLWWPKQKLVAMQGPNLALWWMLFG